MDIQLAEEKDKKRWNSYVSSHPSPAFYHLFEWKHIVEEAFNHKTFYLLALSKGGTLSGVLPLVLMQSSLFGTFMVSLPYFNYGGILTENHAAENALISEAIALGKKYNAEHIELRHRDNKQINLAVKTSKVSMILNLPANSELLFKGFKSKLRSQVRKPEKEGLNPVFGGIDQLDSFYYVFSRNMRDLGTPVYSKHFFSTILKTFPDRTNICTIFKEDKPIASGFLLGFRNKIEIPWASSLRKYNHLSANMMLYWNILKFASDNGFGQFDFGRSTPNEGTYKFKEQWGASPQQLYWHYWTAKPDCLPEINPENPKYQYAIKIWQHLPLCITKLLGPKIVKNIP